MSDVGFDRTDKALLVGGPSDPQHVSQGLRFNRISNRRSGAMRFHIVHLER